MALDPTIILRAGNYKSIDPGELLERRAQLQMRNAAVEKAQRDEQAAMAKTVRLGEIGGMAARGDYAGATGAALSAGDFDLADHVSKLDDRSKAQLREKVTVAAPVFAAALAEPDAAKRTQIIGASLPTLQRYGYTPEEIAQIQPTDEFLRGAVANAQTVEQVLTGQRSDRTYGLDREKFAYTQQHDAAQLATTERGNFLSAGLMPPGGGGGGAIDTPAGGGGDTFARMIGAESSGNQFSRGGGVLTSPKGALGIAQLMPATAPEAARLAGVAFDPERLRSDPAYNEQLGRAYYGMLVNRFGGDEAKAVAAYNAGPGRVEKAVAQAGDQWAQVLPRETRNYLAKVGARGGAGGPQIIPGGKLDKSATAKAPPSGYEWAEDGSLRSIKGGPADNAVKGGENGKLTMQLRKEFDALPEVKTFKTVRAAAQQVQSIASKKNPTATDDIALIFSYMRMLDPNSVVREGEFATAQNAAGVPDQIRNLYNKAKDGTRLQPTQRANMIGSAAQVYQPLRDNYNDVARRYRGYASDAGIPPEKVAYVATPNGRRSGTLKPSAGAGPVRVTSVEQARALAPGTPFITPDGRRKVR